MKSFYVLLIILVIAIVGPTLNADAGQDADSVAEKAIQLDQQSIKSLQISLNSLRWLLGASPYEYLLHASLVKENQLDAVKALEEKGYAKLELVDRLPDGTRGAFLRIIPTAKGQSLIKALAK